MNHIKISTLLCESKDIKKYHTDAIDYILNNSSEKDKYIYICNPGRIWILYNEITLKAIGFVVIDLSNKDKISIILIEIFKEYRGKGYDQVFIGLLRGIFKDRILSVLCMEDSTIPFWWDTLGAQYWIDEILRISTSDPRDIIYYCIAQRYEWRIKSIFMKIWRLHHRGYSISEIGQQIHPSHMKVVYSHFLQIAISSKIPVYGSIPTDPPMKYVVIENGEAQSYGFKFPNRDSVEEWNTYVITIEGEYHTLCFGDTVVIRNLNTGDMIEQTYRIDTISTDLDVCEYPISTLPSMDRLSQISNLSKLANTRPGIIRFSMTKMLFHIYDKIFIVPIIKEYCLELYSIIYDIETYGPITIPSFETYFDVILFMLKTKSICPIFDRSHYTDITIHTK